MQINPFESKKQEEYLNPILTKFQNKRNIPIWLAKGKVKSKKRVFRIL
jgi:hypothetical protein